MERIPSAQPPPCLSKHQSAELSEMQGMDFPMYVYKPRRGMKRGEESKETYKLPHRLIEKKRRDRINECIAQLKDLLPEHLKLTTLGHLEKAVVLELTLKHVKALTSLLEQQQQKILALQSGMQIDQPPPSQDKNEEMFRSGFHLCAKEVLQYLANQEADSDLTPSRMINHLHKVAAEVLQGPVRPRTPLTPRAEELALHHHPAHKEKPAGAMAPKPSEGHGRNCVPVIQRAYAQAGSEQSGNDTDTDSGYGGELEKGDAGAARPSYYGQENELKRALSERRGAVKQEDNEPCHKRQRVESSEDESLSGGESSSSSSSSGHSSYMSMSPHQAAAPHPLCMPFYLIPPSAAAYLPMLEKCWYPGAMPMLYPGLGASATGMASERPTQLMMSPRGGSPAPPAPLRSQTPVDSPALLQALKQVPLLNLETKD
ncbi:class E basic helix-loop-helix protein 40-like isoform X2 [Osmerus mordax]|uniref:class E basic helix-loop-helix protein 40-like isoform X2 n=1 Tax=Osmerus mordax TaxID=8014 RepID=UPI00350FF5D4